MRKILRSTLETRSESIEDQHDHRTRLVSFLLRTGLAIVFLYAALSGFLAPELWLGFLPEFLISFVPGKVLLVAFEIYQIFLAGWLLSGKKQFTAGLLSFLTIIGIIIFNLEALDIIFRDVAILFMAIALMVLHSTWWGGKT